MSMALLIGFIAAYPINWWLVSNHLKHGMMTVRPKSDEDTISKVEKHSSHNGSASHDAQASSSHSAKHTDKISNNMIWIMVIVSFIVFGSGLVFSLMYKA